MGMDEICVRRGWECEKGLQECWVAIGMWEGVVGGMEIVDSEGERNGREGRGDGAKGRG